MTEKILITFLSYFFTLMFLYFTGTSGNIFFTSLLAPLIMFIAILMADTPNIEDR